MITCEQTLQALHTALDAGQVTSATITDHLRSCPACRQAEAELLALERLVLQNSTAQARAENQAGLPSGLHARIMRAVAAESAPRRARPPRARQVLRLSLSFASAAAILLLVFTFVRLQHEPSPTPEGWMSVLLGDAPHQNRTALQTLRTLPVIPREVAEAPDLLARAEDSLASLGQAIFSATGGALRAVSSQPGAALEEIPAPTPKG